MKEKIKVFVPMSDLALVSDSQLYRRLVPFDPSYMVAGHETDEGYKPSNWIPEPESSQEKDRRYTSGA